MPLFPLGQIVATPGALAALDAAGTAPTQLLARHAAGDWGELCDEDRAVNERALNEGFRLLSAYTLGGSARRGKVWIITEADRSVTTILMPDEY